jgi:hypothetical protein
VRLRAAVVGPVAPVERVEGKFEDDYLCWYDVPIGPKRLHPDFIVLHPSACLRGRLTASRYSLRRATGRATAAP